MEIHSYTGGYIISFSIRGNANQSIMIRFSTMYYTNILTGFHMVQKTTPGGRLNKKDGLTRCGDSHVKDKTS